MLQRSVFAGVVLGLLVWLSGVVAPAPGQAAASPVSVTVTGCVERAEQLRTGGANTLGTSLDSQDFVLIRSEVAGEAEPVGTGGAAAGTGSREAPVGRLFWLDGNEALINPHVGHQVRVSGTRSRPAGPAPGAEPRGADAEPSLATAEAVHVESITMLAETCRR